MQLGKCSKGVFEDNLNVETNLPLYNAAKVDTPSRFRSFVRPKCLDFDSPRPLSKPNKSFRFNKMPTTIQGSNTTFNSNSDLMTLSSDEIFTTSCYKIHSTCKEWEDFDEDNQEDQDETVERLERYESTVKAQLQALYTKTLNQNIPDGQISTITLRNLRYFKNFEVENSMAYMLETLKGIRFRLKRQVICMD